MAGYPYEKVAMEEKENRMAVSDGTASRQSFFSVHSTLNHLAGTVNFAGLFKDFQVFWEWLGMALASLPIQCTIGQWQTNYP